jgi:hypothetical protein
MLKATRKLKLPPSVGFQRLVAAVVHARSDERDRRNFGLDRSARSQYADST